TQDLKNPLRIRGLLFGEGQRLSDLWLPIRINGDVAVLKGMMKEMLAEERKRPGAVFDQQFITDFTAGFDRFIEDLDAVNWDDILVSSGVTREHGTDTVETIKQMQRGAIRVFIAMGGNFLCAAPDTEFTAKALQKCRLTAHVSIKLNRSHLITGEIALILPCLGRSEIDRQA